MPTNKFSDWSFNEGHVQAVPESGDFLSSESVVICAGPSTVPSDVNDIVPIGLVQNATVTQNKQIQQLYEIGSRQPIFIPGRTVVQAALSRILFDGPSLMRALYKIVQPSGSAQEGEGPLVASLEQLNSAKEDAERNSNDDLVESFRRIIEAAQKIDPDSKAGYVINDQQGMRYFEVDYNEITTP